MNKELEKGNGVGKKIPVVIFNGNEYFYKWEPDSEILSVYDCKQCKIGTIGASGFYKETEVIRELVVLTLIEAIDKKQRAENLLKNLF